MNCTDAQNLFNRYMDGELGSKKSTILEEHLEACPACRESLGQLRTLVEQAERMPMMISPRRDLWPGIRNRIEEGMAKSTTKEVGIGQIGWPVRSLIAAAAAILIITASVVTVRLFSDGFDSLERFYAGWNQGLVTLAAMEKQYLGVTKDLIYSIGECEDNLTESAREIIEHHLEIIESAIEDSRIALIENPSDTKLQSMLSTTYRQKVELLHWTAQLLTQL